MMRKWSLPILLAAYTLCLLVHANNLQDCLKSSPEPETHTLKDHCAAPLSDITPISPSTSYIVKQPCINCPIVRWTGPRHQSDRLILTDVPNALFYNISLSPDHTTLLLNSQAIFPTLHLPPSPRALYASQISPNFSTADLANTLACTRQPCRDFSGRCDCVHDALWAHALSFEYEAWQISSPTSASPGSEEEKVAWEVGFDAIGGHDGFLKDPYTVWNASSQQKLVIKLQQHGKDSTLEILDVRLAPRDHVVNPAPTPGAGWAKWKLSWSLGRGDVRVPGRVVYWMHEWDLEGRKGTLGSAVRGGSLWVWFAMSVFLSLVSLYGIYRLRVLRREKWDRDRGSEGTTKEREGLLEGDSREEGR